MKHQKHLFSIPEDIVYLNIASQSPSFKAVEKAGIEGVLEKSHPYKITTDSYFEPVKEVKKLDANIIARSSSLPQHKMSTELTIYSENNKDSIQLFSSEISENNTLNYTHGKYS